MLYYSGRGPLGEGQQVSLGPTKSARTASQDWGKMGRGRFNANSPQDALRKGGQEGFERNHLRPRKRKKPTGKGSAGDSEQSMWETGREKRQ